MTVGHVAIADAVNQARWRLFLQRNGAFDIRFQLVITWRRFRVEVDAVDLQKEDGQLMSLCGKFEMCQFETKKAKTAIPSEDSAARAALYHADRRDNFSDDARAVQVSHNTVKLCT